MKPIILPQVLLLLCLSLCCKGQDIPMDVTLKWSHLKTAFQQRNNTALQLTTLMTQSSGFDKNSIKQTRNDLNLFAKSLESQTAPDKKFVHFIEINNATVSNDLSRTLLFLSQDQQFMARKDIIIIFNQLEEAERKIATEIKTYNFTCSNFNRGDLKYMVKANDSAPTIVF